MTIPIRNLYYLFCYAWERFPEGGATEVGVDDCPDLPNLFARILINGVNRILRRGLDRGYVSLEEDIRSPRGRLLLDRTIKEQTLLRGSIYCQFDELQRDVIHNQILKATAVSLAKDPLIKVPLAHELKIIARKLADISDIRLSGEVFRKIQLFRNNGQYTTLMQLCEFVYRAQLPSTTGGGNRFSDILKDEERMSRVFEDFLRNFYIYEQSKFSVAREDMRWRATSALPGDLSLIPIMRTDVTLRSKAKTIVMDAKFYADPFPISSGTKRLRSGHLYQLFAYMKHAGDRGADVPVEGALIYASAGVAASHRYQIDGHQVAIVALDLERPWLEIHRDLIGLVEEGFGPAPPSLEYILGQS